MYLHKIDGTNNKEATLTETKSSTGSEYINTVHPNYMNPEAPATKSFSPNDIHNVVTGQYVGDKITAYGITHYKYEDCNKEDLVDAGGGIKVHKKCYEAFKKMQAAAADVGVNIYIVSGFRSEKYQVTVFKKKFLDKDYPTVDEFRSRLKFSAPSGFSEHHTGLAIDINSTSQSFANTKAYAWLEEHADEYGFEISFPKDGKQGLGFEPWHWRYVGDEESKAVFQAARNND